MAVIVNTENPEDLLSKLTDSIIKGSISTWVFDIDGDLTIANPLWNSKAWFNIKQESQRKRLCFGIVSSTKFPMTKKQYGVYHGSLAATLLANFDDLISNVILTADYDDDYDIYN